MIDGNEAAWDPLVSVYITNHNYARFIQQAIQSVLDQSMRDYELIIIDDGSTDHSRDIIEGFSDLPHVKIIYQEQKGLNVTNNIALRVARGRYLIRLDADDYLDPNALLVLSTAMEADPELGLIFPDYYMVDVDGHILSLERRHDFDREVSLFDQPAHGACTMIRKESLLSVGGYDEGYSCQDGYDLWIKFIDKYRVTNVNLPLFYYRQHGSNLTRNEDRLLDTRAAMKRKAVEEKHPFLRALAMIPVRGVRHDPGCIALRELGGRPTLDRLLDACSSAESVVGVVVTSSDEAVEEYVTFLAKSGADVTFVRRPDELARMNVPLDRTAELVLADPRVQTLNAEVLVTLSPYAPFVRAKSIDEGVHNLTIFDADSSVGVRPESALLFRHTGHGMEPILDQSQFTRLEREALWRNTGSLYVDRVRSVEENGALAHRRVSHVVLSPREAHSIGSEFDWEIAEFLAQRG